MAKRRGKHRPKRTILRVGVHLVWATKYRTPFLDTGIRARLFPYISGIVRHSGGHLLAGGGWRDHVHLYVEMPATISLAMLVSTIKSNSMRWIRESFPEAQAAGWQKGYAAFSVDRRHDDRLMSYIADQDRIHRQRTTESERRALLRAHQVHPVFDPCD